ncbi:MAG: amidohydrolase, partial [Brevibacterium sp.]|nr:amidohydrolase [Brevibacterium sp.]MDN6193358.1 amidohydrolase [Brevibacterium sp.]
MDDFILRDRSDASDSSDAASAAGSPEPPRTDADIPAYLDALGIPGLADIHIHFLPQNVLDKVW